MEAEPPSDVAALPGGGGEKSSARALNGSVAGPRDRSDDVFPVHERPQFHSLRPSLFFFFPEKVVRCSRAGEASLPGFERAGGDGDGDGEADRGTGAQDGDDETPHMDVM